MRKLLSTFVLILTVVVVQAQTRTTTWPYMFDEFEEGTILFADGQSKSKQINIHLLESTLHFLSGSSILETKDTNIVSASVKGQVFLNINGVYVLQIDEVAKDYLGEINKADISSLMESGGAYGSSSNSSSVRELSSYEIGGTNNMNHMYLKQNKDQGKILPIEKNYVFIINNEIIDARYKELKEILSTRKGKDLKSFIKSNKLKWNNIEDLKAIFKYFEEIKE